MISVKVELVAESKNFQVIYHAVFSKLIFWCSVNVPFRVLIDILTDILKFDLSSN